MDQGFEEKSKIFVVILFLILFVLVGRLWQLQILEGGTFSKLSLENAARTIIIGAPRGIIYDRYGKPIVGNRAIFSAYILPSAIPIQNPHSVVAAISQILKIKEKEIFDRIERGQEHPYEPVMIKDNLSSSIVTKLEEEKYKLPGIIVSYRPVRAYPHKSIGVHFLGYVGEIGADELSALKGAGYKLGDLIGKEGIESSYDSYLRGVAGGQQIEVDVYGKPIRTVRSSDPVPGKDIRLTIDLDLQILVEKLLSGKEGAIVVMDPRNGEILALASHPTYDPNIFAAPLKREEWQMLDKRGHPFMNRAISVYPPGSTFKVVTLGAVLEEKLATLSEIITCHGSYKLGNRVASCWMPKGHGELNIIEGLVWSCDVVFYELGLRAGAHFLSRYAKGYGLGEKTGIDLPGEMEGFIPTAAWKKKTLNEDWVKGDSINMGIGQGWLQVTPVQMASLYGTIATGKRFVSHLLKEVMTRDGQTVSSYEVKELGKAPISESNLILLRDALRDVVKRGTGVAAKVAGIPASGKTGTAENPQEPHAWFMCYAPYKDPEIVIISFVGHGEHGDKVTARMARDILVWYEKNRLKTEFTEPDDYNYEQYILHGPYQGEHRL